MRTLRLSWSHAAGAVPLLIAAAVTPASCGANVETTGTGDATSSTGMGGTSSTSTDTGMGGSGGFILVGGGPGTGGTGGTADLCSGPAGTMTFTVPLPPPGVPA